MSNRYDLLFLDEDGAPVAPTMTKKPAVATKATTTEAPAKAAAQPAASKGRMENDRKGKESNRKAPRAGEIESAAELPERADRGVARRGGRQAATNQPTRNFDRHSRAANKEGGEKRQYAGKGNWGNPRDPAEAEAEAAVAASPVEGEEAAAAVDAEFESVPAPIPFITLSQFLAEQEKKKPTVATPAVRAANDGAKINAEVVKKTDDMYFQSAKAAPAATGKAVKAAPAKAAAAPAKAATKFSLQELNAALPGGINRLPRAAREEASAPQGQRPARATGRRLENNTEKIQEARPAFKASLKDSSAFPTL